MPPNPFSRPYAHEALQARALLPLADRVPRELLDVARELDAVQKLLQQLPFLLWNLSLSDSGFNVFSRSNMSLMHKSNSHVQVTTTGRAVAHARSGLACSRTLPSASAVGHSRRRWPSAGPVGRRTLRWASTVGRSRRITSVGVDRPRLVRVGRRTLAWK